MQTITTIGLDIAKSVFQVHGVDNDGKVVIRRQLKRRYVLAFFEKPDTKPTLACGINATAGADRPASRSCGVLADRSRCRAIWRPLAEASS